MVILLISILLFLTIACILSLYYIRKLHRKLQVRERLIVSLEQEREHMNQTFREIRAQRHDFLVHVNVIHHFIEQDKWQEAEKYMAQLVGTISETNAAIRGEQGHMAALLLHTLTVANEHAIKITYDLDTPLSELPCLPTEQSQLIGNLLKNSLEAAMEYANHHGQAEIALRSALRSGLFIIEISNSTMPLPKDVVDSLFRTYEISTKQGDHQGLGTYIIKKIVEQHHGKLDFTYHKQRFTIKIKLPILAEVR